MYAIEIGIFAVVVKSRGLLSITNGNILPFMLNNEQELPEQLISHIWLECVVI